MLNLFSTSIVTMSSPSRLRWGPVRSLLCLAPLLLGAPFLTYKANYGESHITKDAFACQLKLVLCLKRYPIL